MNMLDDLSRPLESMSVSVVIPTRLRAHLLPETLDSLARQTRSEFEVVVVCDGEDPDTRALSKTYIATFPLSWIFTSDNNGQSYARNLGAQSARHDLLVFLDDDTSAAPDWIFQHSNAHQRNARTTAVCGRIVEMYRRPPQSHTERLLREDRVASLRTFEEALLQGDVDRDERDIYAHRCFGLNCSISRATFLERGGFDPALKFIHEDMELGARLYDSGVQFVLQPGAVVYHRDTKDLWDYNVKSLEAIGHIDVYRALKKHQRNPQTASLTEVRTNNPLRKLKLKLCWDHPGLVRKAAQLFRRITDRTGSHFSYKVWCAATGSAGYWEGVRDEGITIENLRETVGWPLPVLKFHSISALSGRNHRKHLCSPEHFIRSMTWLTGRGYKFVFPWEPAQSERSVSLTFDDGYEDFYSEVFPIMSRFRLKPVVFIVVDRFGQTNTWDEDGDLHGRQLLSAAQIRELSSHGVQFGSHTLTHASLPELSDSALRSEIADSKSRLEDLLGSKVSAFAYPYGRHDSRARAAVAEAGYTCAFSTRPGTNFWGDPFSLNRSEIDDNDTSLDLRLKLATTRLARLRLKALRGIRRISG